MITQNYDLVIADTSVLILLDKISRLHILPMLFPRILITKIVAEEFNKELPSEFEILDNSKDKTINVIELTVDRGEASSAIIPAKPLIYKVIKNIDLHITYSS